VAGEAGLAVDAATAIEIPWRMTAPGHPLNRLDHSRVKLVDFCRVVARKQFVAGDGKLSVGHLFLLHESVWGHIVRTLLNVERRAGFWRTAKARSGYKLHHTPPATPGGVFLALPPSADIVD
jgi:hypothetical protein